MMIEYVVEESVRPDGAIRWVVTELSGAQAWSAFTEEEGLVLALRKASANGVIRVGTRNGQYSDYTVVAAQQRIDDLRSPNMAHPSPAPQHTVMGVRFIIANAGTKGEFRWTDADQGWVTDQETYDAMRADRSNESVRQQIKQLRQARLEGKNVVAGRVTNNPRRPAPAPRQRKGDLHDLAERTKRMVVQIAAMSDKGPIPDGQVAELSKTYASLQAEFDEALSQVEDIKDNLSIMRAIMFEHSDPRNARDAIA